MDRMGQVWRSVRTVDISGKARRSAWIVDRMSEVWMSIVQLEGLWLHASALSLVPHKYLDTSQIPHLSTVYTAVQCSAVQCSAVQCSAVQCSALYST